MTITLSVRLLVPIVHIGMRFADRRGRLTVLNDTEEAAEMVDEE
jgi:hypothetical protein